MAEEDTERSFHINWPVWLMYAGRFGKVIDSLEAKGCISKDSAVETKKKIAEASELIIAATEDHDKDKQHRAEDLVHEIMQALFETFDNCYDKYAGSRVR